MFSQTIRKQLISFAWSLISWAFSLSLLGASRRASGILFPALHVKWNSRGLLWVLSHSHFLSSSRCQSKSSSYLANQPVLGRPYRPILRCPPRAVFEILSSSQDAAPPWNCLFRHGVFGILPHHCKDLSSRLVACQHWVRSFVIRLDYSYISMLCNDLRSKCLFQIGHWSFSDIFSSCE